jgi:cell wall-associated NlpC family hydrolase
VLKDLIGVPFVEGGRNPLTGLDCLGLTRIVVKRIVDADVPEGYVKEASSESVLDFQQESFKRWERIDELEIGCAVVMRMDGSRPDLVQHVGVYIGDGKIIQSLKKIGVHIARLDDPLIKNRIEGYYRWKKEV